MKQLTLITAALVAMTAGQGAHPNSAGVGN